MKIEQYSTQRMQELMQARGLTAYKVAKLCGYPHSTVSNYMRGYSLTTPLFLDSFCRVVGISMSEFYADYK